MTETQKASKSSDNVNILWKSHTPRIKITKIKLRYLEVQASESISQLIYSLSAPVLHSSTEEHLTIELCPGSV